MTSQLGRLSPGTAQLGVVLLTVATNVTTTQLAGIVKPAEGTGSA